MHACTCDVQPLTDVLWLPERSPTIREGERNIAHRNTRSQKLRKIHLLQEAEYNNHGNMRAPTAPLSDVSYLELSKRILC